MLRFEFTDLKFNSYKALKVPMVKEQSPSGNPGSLPGVHSSRLQK